MQLSTVPDPFYYVENFRAMLDTLTHRDGDLLTIEERQFMSDFERLPKASRALLVRLVMRKGPLFRASRLRYPEITDLDAAVLPLLALRWVDAQPALDLDALFRVCTKAEVVRFLGVSREHRRQTKPAMLHALRDQFPLHQTFEHWCNAPERVLRLEIAPLCERLRLMFFGNFRQDLSEFVLADLGVVRFESPPLHARSRPFATRRQVDDFHRLYRCREMLYDGGALPDVESALPSRIEDCDWLEERRTTLLFRIGRAYERSGFPERAAALYSVCAHTEAPIRLQRMADKAAGRVRRRSQPKTAVPVFDLVLDQPATALSIEHRVRDHLQAMGGEMTEVHYVENALVNSLFGLLCWSAVFAPIRGAFFHSFHYGPADLSSAGFVARRREEFAACVDELATDAYKNTIRHRFRDKFGVASPFVAWGLVNERLLETALECFPAQDLRIWFDWMLRDLRVNRSGFPDLVQFWPQSCRYRLIEVKAPGDRLQDNQRSCLEYLLQHRVPVAVCQVRYAL